MSGSVAHSKVHEGLIAALSEVAKDIDYDIWKATYNPEGPTETSIEDAREELEYFVSIVRRKLRESNTKDVLDYLTY